MGIVIGITKTRYRITPQDCIEPILNGIKNGDVDGSCERTSIHQYKNAIVHAIAMAQLIASVNGLVGNENDLRMYLVLVDYVN